MMKCTLVMIENKPYLRLEFYYKGKKVEEEMAKVYGWKDRPYIRRLRERLPLTQEMIEGKTVTYE